MTSRQKWAWLTLVAFGLGVLGFLVLTLFRGSLVARAAFALPPALGILAPLLFGKRRHTDEVAEDERDEMIAHKATLRGGILSYVAFIAACMIPWFICMIQGRKVIWLHALPMIVLAGVAVFFVSRAITILVLYGRGATDAED